MNSFLKADKIRSVLSVHVQMVFNVLGFLFKEKKNIMFLLVSLPALEKNKY
jgi:hypothetical protein